MVVTSSYGVKWSMEFDSTDAYRDVNEHGIWIYLALMFDAILNDSRYFLGYNSPPLRAHRLNDVV